MLPEGWKISKLGEISRITTGSTPPTKNESFYYGDILFITPADLGENKYVTQTERTLSSLGAECTRLIPKGSVLFSCIGTIGKIGINKEDSATNQQINSLFPNENNNSDFIYYSLILYKPSINNLASKQAVPIINKKTFSNVPILIPPLPEQKKIAAILSTWDRAIEGTEKLLANSQQQKKALMQQLLTGKKRLPGFTGEWKFTTLDSLTDQINNGLNYDSKTTSGLPVTRIETISLGKIDFSKIGYAPDNDKTRNFKLESGDILYSHINSIDHIGKVSYYNHEKDLYHGMNLLNIRTNKKNSSCYLYYIFQSHIGKKFAVTHAKSAVNQASISISDLKMFLLKMPPLPEQKTIAAVLSTADEEITAIEADLARLRQEKKALMQQLLTGKRRVKVD
ncbi:restriction endonuclease subunit S [Komagataeibacter sp. FNDCR1]|nr:restriction endonuclease subunit S [Komagataeibacter sp. FNDCR1]